MIYDALVIGGGQAGLIAGYRLKQAGFNYIVLDSLLRAGDRWRVRYDGLRLFTPNSFNRLPDYDIPVSKESDYLSKDEFADYLESFSRDKEINIRFDSHVTQVYKGKEFYKIETSNKKSFKAKRIIIANGAFQNPIIPKFNSNTLPQFTADTVSEVFKTKGKFENVLVVGDGASGRQISKQLSLEGFNVSLSCGKKRLLLPQKILYKDIFRWLKLFGLVNVSRTSWLGKKVAQRDPFPDTGINEQKLIEYGVKLKKRVEGINNHSVIFSDGSVAHFDCVIWTIGYESDYRFLGVSNKKPGINQNLELSNFKNIYLLSKPWLRNRASGLICGVDEDVTIILNKISREK